MYLYVRVSLGVVFVDTQYTMAAFVSKTFKRGSLLYMKQNDRLRTGDSTLVRKINLSVIMNHLRKKAPISRAGLAPNLVT